MIKKIGVEICTFKKNSNNNSVCKTMSGELQLLGVSKVDLKIFDLTYPVWLFVVNNSDHDIVVGLDLIQKFGLCQDHKLRITQHIEHQAIPLEIKKKLYSDVCKSDSIHHSKNYQNKNKNNLDELLDISNLHLGHSTSPVMEINWNEYMPIEKFEANMDHLGQEEKKTVFNLIDEYKSVFAKDKYDVGTFTEQQAHIKLLENKYVARKPYKCSFDDQEEISRQINGLLKAGLIEESSSPFAAPVTMAFRKSENEKNRMCVDFRELNKLIIPETYPFPTIDDILQKTKGCEYFSSLDINSAFWSIPVRYGDRQKTGFVTQDGHFQWKCLPFGIKVASPIYQRILSGIIRKHNLSSFCVNYIDDILIFSSSFDEHIRHLRLLFAAIVSEGFRLKFLKCKFACKEVQYLGHDLSKDQVKPLTDNVVSIRDFPIPENKKQVRSFLGKVNFYNKYIPHSAIVLEPLHSLLRKNVPFIWSEECQQSFDSVKKMLISKPILAIFDRNRITNIFTDASLLGVGAVLKQVQDSGEERPVAYFSRKLTPAQKKKKAVFLECLAVKEALKYWQYLLLGMHFTVYTDHKPLENFNVSVRPDEELGDMMGFLSQFDFQLIYRPGSENHEADCLSRGPVIEPDAMVNSDIIKTANLLSLDEIKSDQINIPPSPHEFLHDASSIRYINSGTKRRILLSDATCRTLANRIHLNFGHIGYNHMISMLQPFYYSKNFYSVIRNITSSCDTCTRNKTRTKRKAGLLGHLGPASAPFEVMSLDTIGGFGGRRSTKKYLHLLVDHFTRFAYISTSATQNSRDFINILSKVQRKNNVGMLLTDQYGGLLSKEFEDYLSNKNITHVFTATDSPFSNGLNERLNQTLVNRIRCKINDNSTLRRAWTSVAADCVREYNDTAHSSTGFSPNYLMNGVFPNIVPPELLPSFDLVDDRHTAFINSCKSHDKNKKRFDKKKCDVSFQVGDNVFIENGNRLNRDKLDSIRIGPFPIVKKISDHVYLVACGPSSREKRLFHISKMIGT